MQDKKKIFFRFPGLYYFSCDYENDLTLKKIKEQNKSIFNDRTMFTYFGRKLNEEIPLSESGLTFTPNEHSYTVINVINPSSEKLSSVLSKNCSPPSYPEMNPIDYAVPIVNPSFFVNNKLFRTITKLQKNYGIDPKENKSLQQSEHFEQICKPNKDNIPDQLYSILTYRNYPSYINFESLNNKFIHANENTNENRELTDIFWFLYNLTDDDELKKILQLIKEDHNIALGIYKIFKGIQMCKNESFLLFD